MQLVGVSVSNASLVSAVLRDRLRGSFTLQLRVPLFLDAADGDDATLVGDFGTPPTTHLVGETDAIEVDAPASRMDESRDRTPGYSVEARVAAMLGRLAQRAPQGPVRRALSTASCRVSGVSLSALLGDAAAARVGSAWRLDCFGLPSPLEPWAFGPGTDLFGLDFATHATFPDSMAVKFGTGFDASIDYDGTDLRIFADLVAPGLTPGQIGSIALLLVGFWLWRLGGKAKADPTYAERLERERTDAAAATAAGG
jgi:hypothetical protein